MLPNHYEDQKKMLEDAAFFYKRSIVKYQEIDAENTSCFPVLGL